MCQGLTQWALVPFGLTIKQTIIHKHDNVTNKIMKQHKKNQQNDPMGLSAPWDKYKNKQLFTNMKI